MRKHRVIIVLVVLIAIVGVALVVRACLPPLPRRNLLARATKLSDIRLIDSYSWISSTELIVKTSTNGIPTRFSSGNGFRLRSLWTGSVDSIDARTGKRTRLNGLTTAILQHSKSYIGPRNFEESQDGQWLLWTCENPNDLGDYPVTARRDGSEYHEWRHWADREIEWIDGHRWITIVYPPVNSSPLENDNPKEVIVHDAAQPALEQRLPASSPEAQALMKAGKGPLDGTIDTDASGLEAIPNQRAFSLDIEIWIHPSGAAKGAPGTRLDTVSLPADSQEIYDMHTPQASCMGLIFSETGIPPYVTLLRKLFPNYPYRAYPTEVLYVYRADRKEWGEIGRVPKPSSHHLEIQNASLLPDGKHIQFFYHDAVYVVSTE